MTSTGPARPWTHASPRVDGVRLLTCARARDTRALLQRLPGFLVRVGAR